MSSDLEGRLAHARPPGEAAPDLVVPREDAGPTPKHLASLATVEPTPDAPPATVVTAVADPEPVQDVPAPSATRRAVSYTHLTLPTN